MNIANLKCVVFIGIGGIGMSALARFFLQRGVQVSGYDRTPTDLTRLLSDEGAAIHYTDDVNLVDRAAEVVVYTPAIPPGHAELAWYRANNYPVFKRSDVLQWITESMRAITVAGTHGKTTISTMTAYLLREAGNGANAFLGGISANYGVNYWKSEEQLAVIEADEYDRSFLKLKPDVALLSAMDADHLDIYGTAAEMELAYVQYTQNIKPGGTLLYKHGLPHAKDFGGSTKLTYSLQNNAADYYVSGIVQKDGGYHFTMMGPGVMLSNLYLPMGGMHNVENAVAALALARMEDADDHQLRAALQAFKGVKRRFEYVVKNKDHVYIDDYAHHPAELTMLISGAKRLFPKRKCVIVFQPHLFSRTRDLADEFAHALDLADEVLLMPVYAAREVPVAGITSELIARKMGNPNHTILSAEGVLDYARAARPPLFITAGAGDIDKLAAPLKILLENA